MIGLGLVLIVTCMAVGASWISPFDPTAADLTVRNRPPGFASAVGRVFVLGTDQLGRDMLSRVIYGARIAVVVSFSAVLISGSIGSALGIFAGFAGGSVDSLIMRFVDLQLAVPMILLAIVWAAFVGPGVLGIVLIIGLWGWVQYARLARGMTLVLKQREFVLAARSIGAPQMRIAIKHLAPNIVGTLVVMATIQLGQAVLLESALSFLGVGVQAPTPSWGGMLTEGRAYLDQAWWIAVFPGLALGGFVLGANLLGDALRDALEPRLTRSGRS